MKMQLYHRWNCPESEAVRNFIEINNLESDIEYLDVEDDIKNRFDLKTLTGNLQVPCLVVGGTPIQHRELILEWLRENLLEESLTL